MKIGEYFDTELVLPANPQLALAQFHARRLHWAHTTAEYWSVVPRRLGRDASGSELAADKRVCRSVAHFAGVCGQWWCSTLPDAWDDLATTQLRPNPSWSEEARRVEREFPAWRTEVCTVGCRDPRLARWSRQALHRLEQELLSWQEVGRLLVVHGL